jgi:hypothetical protein
MFHGRSMNLSIPLSGIQTADAAFDSAARSVVQAFAGGTPGQAEDSVSLSSAVTGLLTSSLDFTANVKVAIVEDNLDKNALSILG